MTPQAPLFGRQVVVRLIPGDGGDVRELRSAAGGPGLSIKVRSKKATTGSAATCTIEIINSALDSISAISQPGSVVEVYAGYSGQLPNGVVNPQLLGVPKRIWHGNPVYGGVKSESKPPDTVLTIEASDGGNALSTARVSISFATQTTLRQIIAEALRQTGIPSDVTTIPETVYPAGYRFVGKPGDLFSQLAVSAGQSWFIRDGAFNFTGTSSAESVLLSSSTGMVGSPTPKSDGSVEVKSLLNPAIRVGGSVELQSVYVNGSYTVQSLETSLDSGFGGDYYMILTCRKKG